MGRLQIEFVELGEIERVVPAPEAVEVRRDHGVNAGLELFHELVSAV